MKYREMAHARMADMDMQVAAAVLSQRYEQQLFSQGSRHSKVVPVLVITGFLGSGKTTLLQHLLATAGSELKLGVLVNEVAAIDVDGQLLRTTQSNAAAGIKAAQLAGGCACCSVSGDLQAALHELAGSSSYQQLDYLLLETSGVADVEPLASLLSSSGFKLSGVVAVVDAEAGSGQLQHEDVALAQLRAADVVVINKCDLASLSTLSSVEDLVQDKAPGIRMLRARFGQVPAEALLDVDVEEAGADSTADNSAAATQPQSVQGEIAFLSHEPVVTTKKLKGRERPGSLVSSQRAARQAASAGDSQHHHQHQHSTAHSHSSFVSVSFSSQQPLCMACFQAFVTHQLVPAVGLFRAKGFVWFQQQRSLHYIFHVSGKQRAECGATGAWQGAPGVQVVLIGQDKPVLIQLKQRLQECVAGCCACMQSSCQQPAGHQTGKQTAVEASTTQAGSHAAAAKFAQLVQEHHRFQLWQQGSDTDGQTPQQHVSNLEQLVNGSQGLDQQEARSGQQDSLHQTQQKQQEAGGGHAQGLVQFTAVGSALHGVIADEVNAAVLRTANASSGLLFMCHVKSPPALRTAAASSQQVAYQGVVALQLCFRSGDTAAYAEQQWQQFEAAVAAVLRKAYQHVHNCKCDVVQMMTAV